MGRQINFFLHPNDQKDFDDFLKSFDDICFLPYYHKSDSISLIDDTIIRDDMKEGRRVCLVRKQDLKNIKFVFIEKFDYWLINDTVSPVLHFDRCVSIDNSLSSGRLYFQPKYVENLMWINQDSDFIIWADKIISAVKRKLKKYRFKYEMSSYEYNAYLSLDAMNLILENKAEISLPGDRLTIKQ